MRLYPAGHVNMQGRVTFISPETYPGIEQEAERIEQERALGVARTLAALKEAAEFQQKLERDREAEKVRVERAEKA